MERTGTITVYSKISISIPFQTRYLLARHIIITMTRVQKSCQQVTVHPPTGSKIYWNNWKFQDAWLRFSNRMIFHLPVWVTIPSAVIIQHCILNILQIRAYGGELYNIPRKMRIIRSWAILNHTSTTSAWNTFNYQKVTSD